MTQITAHSGSDGTADNCLSFIQFFLDKPIDALEVDIRKNHLGELVLNHDALELREYPSLKEAFLLLKGSKILLNCDLKESNLETEVEQLARTCDYWEFVQLSGAVSMAFVQRWPEKVLVNIENTNPVFLLEDWYESDVFEALSFLANQGAKVINIHYKQLTRNIYQKGRRLGLNFSVWTVNDLDKIQAFQEQGVYNITTRSAWVYLQLKEDQHEVLKSETIVS